MDYNGNIAKDSFFVMPHKAVLSMSDDFSQDRIWAGEDRSFLVDPNATIIDEEAIYVIGKYISNKGIQVDYYSYSDNIIKSNMLDQDDGFTDSNIERDKLYIGRRKTNGKISLTRDDSKSKDFKLLLGKRIEDITGNFIVIGNDNYLISNTLVYRDGRLISSSVLEEGMKVDLLVEGIRVKMIGFDN